MRLTKKVAKQNRRNNASSLSCDDYSSTNISRNNNCDIVWRQWSDK